jgi:ADP-dependent NAD(P)H-hydrate dehydratase / NAD(P)H-hydrate epimerase
MKIFSSEQIRNIDRYTILHEPVSPFALMERASGELFTHIKSLVNRNDQIVVFAGTGNNGGDGLAIARMLLKASYSVTVYIINISDRRSDEWNQNLQLLNASGGTGATLISEGDSAPALPDGAVVIDAVFGSGLTRAPEGVAAMAIRTINDSGAFVISVDVPSGLAAEENPWADAGTIVRADHTLVIQFPRLSFMFAENSEYTGAWRVVPIGLHPVAIAMTESPFNYLDAKMVASSLKNRRRFAHKGDFGHALLAAGSQGKMGAAILGARAALRTGVGLLTCHLPGHGNDIMQVAVTEAMTIGDRSDHLISSIENPQKYDAVAIGPGMGTTQESQEALSRLLKEYAGPLVIDADAINILGMNRDWLVMLPENAILTPHPKEFARIAGDSENSYKRLEKQIALSRKLKCVIVLKGAHTSISLPDGRVFFNSNGNPGMATAGSGDVLTGIVLALLAQGYEAEKAAVTAVFMHGLAGDIAAGERGQESMIASDITDKISAVYTKIREHLL